MANKKIKERNFLYSTGRVRSLERELLTGEKLYRMIDAKTDDDALKVLYECGYQDIITDSGGNIDEIISRMRLKLFKDDVSILKDERIINIFKLKYDVHNIKSYIKGGEYGLNIMIDSGTIDKKSLSLAIGEGDYSYLPEFWSESKYLKPAIESAKDILAKTGDPQLADFEIDKAMYSEMLLLAIDTGSAYLIDFVKLSIDAANIRTYVRARRMGKGYEILRLALIEGGNINHKKLMQDMTGETLIENAPTLKLKAAAEAGVSIIEHGGRLSILDKLCDDAIMDHLRSARYISFGEQPVCAYFYAKEQELTSVRTIMTGRQAGLTVDEIRERLRDTYA